LRFERREQDNRKHYHPLLVRLRVGLNHPATNPRDALGDGQSIPLQVNVLDPQGDKLAPPQPAKAEGEDYQLRPLHELS
jgi:hypothetical protein